MKGVINKGIKEMIEARYGHDKWNEIRMQAGCEKIFFSATENYPDHLTITLLAAVGKTLSMPVEDVMIEFGKFWINNTSRNTYPQIFHLAGRDARTFLRNINRIHTEAIQSAPNAAPPRFEYDDMPDGRLAMHYFGRKEMIPLLKGLVLGVGKYFNQTIEIEVNCEFKQDAVCTLLLKIQE